MIRPAEATGCAPGADPAVPAAMQGLRFAELTSSCPRVRRAHRNDCAPAHGRQGVARRDGDTCRHQESRCLLEGAVLRRHGARSGYGAPRYASLAQSHRLCSRRGAHRHQLLRGSFAELPRASFPPRACAAEAERLSKTGATTSKEQVECLLMLGRLQALNQNHEANKSEIQKIVSSLTRSFNKAADYDFPGQVRAAPHGSSPPRESLRRTSLSVALLSRAQGPPPPRSCVVSRLLRLSQPQEELDLRMAATSL